MKMLKILTDNCLLFTGHCKKDTGYITEQAYKSIYTDAEEISKMLWKIIMNSQKSGDK